MTSLATLTKNVVDVVITEKTRQGRDDVKVTQLL